MNPEKIVTNFLSKADIKVNGDRDFDIQVHDKRVYNRILKQGTLGVGESYVEGWWDCKSIDRLFDKIACHQLHKDLNTNFFNKLTASLYRLYNFQTISRAKKSITKHYDLGNKLFENTLDKEMNYSCGFWKNATNLNEAQQDKMNLICKKLKLSSGMRLLDIGCGFGALAKHAAKYWNVEVVGVTVSKNQAEYAKKNCEGLAVTIELKDYRKIEGTFDRIVSVGMFEHVGYKNYKNFMRIAHNHLSDDGLFLLHTIGNNRTEYAGDPWIHKYIFPDGMLPSIQQIGSACEPYFVMEDWHNFGAYYDKTLLAWFNNFDKNWDHLKTDYDEEFYRLWKYYLLSCSGLFRARSIQLWQIVFSKYGLKGGYQFRY